MTPLVLALTLAAPAQPPTFVATGTGDEMPTGTLVALSLPLGAQLKTLTGEQTVKGLVSLRRTETALPAVPVGAQLVTAIGDRIPGTLDGGDAKTLKFRPSVANEDWLVALDAVAAVWITAPPADTPVPFALGVGEVPGVAPGSTVTVTGSFAGACVGARGRGSGRASDGGVAWCASGVVCE